MNRLKKMFADIVFNTKKKRVLFLKQKPASKRQIRRTGLQIEKQIMTNIALAVFACGMFAFSVVFFALAAELQAPQVSEGVSDQAMFVELQPVFPKEQTEEHQEVLVRKIQVRATAYNSLPNQTDGSPYITANGMFVYDGLLAANFLPLGTKVKIPQYFGDQEFTVNDRMNAKYQYGVIDIWMTDIHAARQWGSRYITIEIYE